MWFPSLAPTRGPPPVATPLCRPRGRESCNWLLGGQLFKYPVSEYVWHIYIYMCIYIICIYIYVYICVYICIYICRCAEIDIYICTWTSKRTKKSVQPLKRTLIASSYLNWWNEPKSWKRTLLAKRPEIWARKGPVAISISRMPLGTTDFPKWCAYDLFVLNSQGVCKCTQSTGPSRYCIWLFCFFSMSPKAWQCQISDLKPIT